MNKDSTTAIGMEREKAAELPGRPIIQGRGEPDRDLPVRFLLTGPTGEVLLLSGSRYRAEHAAEALADCFGRKVDVVYFSHSEHDYTDDYGFALSRAGGVRTLTLPERAIAAAMVDYCARHIPGLRIDKPVALPKVLHDESDIADGYIHDFTDEARAYMLADVCEDVFCLETEVVDDSNGWTVIIRDDDCDTINAELLAELHGVCRLLQRFAVCSSPMGGRTEAPEIRAEARARKAARWRETNRLLVEIKESCSRIEAAGGVPAGQ